MVGIASIETTEFQFPLENVGYLPEGFRLVYKPGTTTLRRLFGVRIETTEGITSEYVGGNSPAMAQVNMVSDYRIGKNLLHQERHWSELKRALRKYDRMGIGPIDIALWDFAGKYHDAPIHELLGTYRRRLPAYASIYEADRNGELNSPTAFADFAEECRERGFPDFKIHAWGGEEWRDQDREITIVRAVGNEMDLMLDPVCQYEMFADALKVGKGV